MIAVRWRLVAFAFAVASAAAPDVPLPARAASYTIRCEPAGASIDVAGIDPANLAALSRVAWDPARWAELLAVTTAPGADAPAVLGRYRVESALLRFSPRFPIEPGLRHRVRFRPSRLPLAAARPVADVATEFTRPVPPPPAPATVVRVDPSGARLPENLLKFYLHFSRPMSRGEAYERVRLLDADGRPCDRPFLELGEELWDPSGTRLTLLLDPGRIKRGLKPRDEEGPILEAGKLYTLVIDRAWHDAGGYPLRESFRKSFRADPADETQPVPTTWTVVPPAAGTRDPLAVTFPEPLDRAMLDRALVVHDPDGRPAAGRVAVDKGETRWRFVPDRPWSLGTHRIVVDTTLEDRAGNSVARPFEVDLVGPNRGRIEVETVAIPFAIR